MKLIIDIPEEEYEKNKLAKCDYHTLRMAIKNGIPLIEELEKIKAEIKEEEEKGIYYECEEWPEGRPCDEDYFFGLLRAIMFIDKHISELKGE